jgi:hypothetical protein
MQREVNVVNVIGKGIRIELRSPAHLTVYQAERLIEELQEAVSLSRDWEEYALNKAIAGRSPVKYAVIHFRERMLGTGSTEQEAIADAATRIPDVVERLVPEPEDIQKGQVFLAEIKDGRYSSYFDEECYDTPGDFEKINGNWYKK